MTSSEEEIYRIKLQIENLESERGELLERLHRSESREQLGRLVIDRFSDGLLLIDGSDRVVVANPTAASLLQMQEDRIEGQMLTGFENDHTAKLWIAINSSPEGGMHEIEFSNSIIVQAHVSITVHDGRTYRIIVLHDISRDKALNEMKGEFVSIAAHQLRTPLAAIKWAFEIALSGLQKDTDPYKAAERGHESSERMLELVNSLLDVDRIESSRFDYRFETMDLSEAVKLYLEQTAQEKALLHGVRLSFGNETGAPILISGDKQKINLVLQNLIENALKYTPQGGQVRAALTTTSDHAILSISDTGIGIPLADQSRLFEKFFRADNAKRQVADGSGLGLYIIRRIVESHGGGITFKSEPGNGTTFTLTFPLQHVREAISTPISV